MIALSARTEPADIEAGRDAGFTDYVAKFQRDALIASLNQCLAERSWRNVAPPQPPPAELDRNRIWASM